MLPTDETSAAGYGLSALAYLVLALHLLWAGRGRADQLLARTLPMAALVATGAWGLAEWAGWGGLATVFDVLRYAAWCGFLLVSSGFARSGPARPGRGLRLALVSGLALAGVLLMAAALTGGVRTRVHFALLLALPVGACVLLEQLFRNLPDDSRWHAKPFCIGLACVFLFDVYMASVAMMFGAFDAATLNARGIVHAIAVPFLYVAAQRSGDWVSKLQVSRKAMFHSATLLLAGVYLLLVASVGYYVRYFGGSWGGALQLTLLFAALALGATAMLSGTVRSHLRVLVGKHFFRYRYDYREEWLRFTARLSARGTATEVAQHVLRGLADMVECGTGGVWLRTEAGGGYTAVARLGLADAAQEEPASGSLCRFLADTGWVVDVDEWRRQPGRYEGLALPNWLAHDLPDARLVVPLLVGGDLLGFVVLGRPRTALEVNWEVLDLLKTASRQAAGYLAQMQATEALLEARKFEAFNRMSAFVVHDLKNIVTQLSLMLKNAERLHANPEFQQDMLLTVESSLEKMRRLMLQLREGAAPPGGAAGVELEPIVARLQAMAAARGRALEVTQLEPVATRGHDDRLERVLGHLVHNALDATPPEGRVWIGVSRFSGQVMIEVGDTGSGMTEEFIQTRLFKPFSSTKGSGMGVGTYESQQYVRELGGSIAVESEPGAGTVVTVRLPLFDRVRGSDLMPLDALR